MKNFRINIIIFLLLVISFIMNAQDTIYFKDKSMISSKIIEIGITEIKYQKFENIMGPIYTVLKNDIKSIKYSTGEIDSVSFAFLKTKEVDLNKNQQFANSLSNIELKGTELFYKGNKLGIVNMDQLINNNSLTENQRNLILEVKSFKMVVIEQKNSGKGLIIGGFVVPALVTGCTLLVSLSYGNIKYPVETIIVGACIGAIMRTTGFVLHRIGRNKAKATKLEFLAKHPSNEFIY